MPFSDEYILPLSQHVGKPSIATVKKGQKVSRGEIIAIPDGFVSVALHSPVDGVVDAVDKFNHPNGQVLPGIRIKTDPFSTQMRKENPLDFLSMDEAGFISSLQMAGIVGMGGAAFPAHVKFSLPADKRCQFLILNGCECEPFLTVDHRMMVEFSSELIDGISILQKYIKAEKIFIGIENNKPDAISTLNEEIRLRDVPIEVIPLKVKYPQGAEKMLITAILNREIPRGKLPLDMRTLVSNIGTVIAISNYFRKSEPLIERVITVTGTAVRRPANVLVPLGVSMREVVEYCGGITEDASRILLGGPMMGNVQKNLDVPVVKGTSGILILTEKEVRDITEYKCIRCSRCVDACPLFLNPSLLGLLARKGLWDEMYVNDVMECFECASCSFVCPSGIPLVQSIRVGKSMIREKRTLAAK